MAKGVFTTRVNLTYDDLPEVRYHFPKTYLNQIKATVSDWIIYDKPRREGSGPTGSGGRQAYFATARVQSIEADTRLPNHFYAFVTDFLEFEIAVPFQQGGKYLEKALMKEDGSTNRGACGRAVRLISDSEYQVILQLGFEKPSINQSIYASQMVAEEPAEENRFTVDQLVSRPFRDAAFAKNIRTIYDYTCAMSGLRLVNGEGRSEVEAAHIRPVGNDHHGPDSVRNGIALSRSIHWMFDRGLLSLSDDHEILMARRLVPNSVKRLLYPDGMILTPTDPSLRPHPQFLRYHREHIFKG